MSTKNHQPAHTLQNPEALCHEWLVKGVFDEPIVNDPGLACWLRLGHLRRSTGAAPSRVRAARAKRRLPWMRAMAWSGSTCRRRPFADCCFAWRQDAAGVYMTGERLLDLGGRAWPRAIQPALRLPCRLGQLAHRLVGGQEGRKAPGMLGRAWP